MERQEPQGLFGNPSRAPHPSILGAVFQRSDAQGGLRALGPRESAPTRRVVQVAPILFRTRASYGWLHTGGNKR